VTPCEYAEHTQHAFDSYCKKVVKLRAHKYYVSIRNRQNKVSLFSDLTKSELAKLAKLAELITSDIYFASEFVFAVLNVKIGIADHILGKALSMLQPDKRDIILQYYFFGLNDKEVAENLRLNRRTVTQRRNNSLKILRRFMEDAADEE